MKALLPDGREIDLGSEYITILGEPGDKDTVNLVNVRGTAMGCYLSVVGCYLTAEAGHHNVLETPISKQAT